jgi:hypothetical protein
MFSKRGIYHVQAMCPEYTTSILLCSGSSKPVLPDTAAFSLFLALYSLCHFLDQVYYCVHMRAFL